MTEKDLEKIFAEVRTEVYSPEYRAKIEERIKQTKGIGDSGIERLSLALETNSELDKAFMFRVLAKALSDSR